MTYCIATGCPKPKNAPTARFCKTCGSKLWLRDRYRVLGALGRGGFGATFLARDQALPGYPPCVIKQLRPTTAEPHLLEMARDLFQREANILGKIGNHPQLPRLLDYFEIANEFYLVQEYVRGSTIQKEVKHHGPFTETGVKQFLNEVLPVVRYIHNSQIIHRDIKPANLIRREQDQQLVIIDFGAVKDKVNPPQVNASDQTALTAYAIGTPGYAPPEQMAMRPVYASDLYAIGVTCVYLLTGRSPKDLPYDPQTGELRWYEYAFVSGHFDQVLRKMLDISVHNRYQKVEDIMRDLDLEPHIDSLSQSMAFATAETVTAARKKEKQEAQEERVSPTSRMAAAIRARRERRSSKNDSTYTGVERRRRKPTAASLKESYTKGYRDFSNQILSQLDLQRYTLSGTSFAKATLRKTNLLGADLSSSNFSHANLTQATLKNAKLSGAYLGGANLEGTDLRGANLTRASLESANLKDANLCGADLTGATITPEQLDVARTNWSTIHPNGRRSFL